MSRKNVIRYEIDRDYGDRFFAGRYRSTGYYPHIHRNLELYGVIRGSVSVTVAGKQATLTDGQMAVIDGLERHSFHSETEAEVFVFHIGTHYSGKLCSMYPNRRLPVFLQDAAYNRKLYAQISPLFDRAEEVSEMKRFGISYQLFADIIAHYGTVEKLGNVEDDCDIVNRVVQYIYEHYSEPITLASLSREFFISPKALSKKIGRRLNMDLRLFVNDVRVQKAIRLREDPAYRNRSLDEIAAMCGFSSMVTFYRSYERNFRFDKPESQEE